MRRLVVLALVTVVALAAGVVYAAPYAGRIVQKGGGYELRAAPANVHESEGGGYKLRGTVR